MGFRTPYFIQICAHFFHFYILHTHNIILAVLVQSAVRSPTRYASRPWGESIKVFNINHQPDRNHGPIYISSIPKTLPRTTRQNLESRPARERQPCSISLEKRVLGPPTSPKIRSKMEVWQGPELALWFPPWAVRSCPAWCTAILREPGGPSSCLGLDAQKQH